MRTRILILVTVALVATSCAEDASSPSLIASASEDQGGSLPPASPETSPLPSQSESALVGPDFQPDDFVEVLASRLAVRSGPGIEFPLVSEYLLGRTEPLETTLLRREVRLDAGYVVRIVLGPIIRGETVWFAVDNVAQDGQSGLDAPLWRTTAPVPYSEIDFELTWMAAAQPGAFFARLTDPPACTECFDPPPAVVAATGTGEGVLEWPNRDFWITMAAAAKEPGGTCEFTWQIGDQAPIRDEHVVAYFAAQLPPMQPSPGTEQASLVIAGDCSWAATVRVATG